MLKYALEALQRDLKSFEIEEIKDKFLLNNLTLNIFSFNRCWQINKFFIV